MGRNRTFDEDGVVERCAEVFRRTGYEGSSIDDLVAATGLHRGSLYSAFGSKRGLFVSGADSEPKGLRAPGLNVPGKWSGTFTKDGDRSFWNVSAPGETVVVELSDEHYARLFLTVDQPHSIVDAVDIALQQH